MLKEKWPVLLRAGLGLQVGDEGEDDGGDCEGDEDEDPEGWGERPDQGEEFRFQFRIGSHEHHVVNVERDCTVQHLSSEWTELSPILQSYSQPDEGEEHVADNKVNITPGSLMKR